MAFNHFHTIKDGFKELKKTRNDILDKLILNAGAVCIPFIPCLTSCVGNGPQVFILPCIYGIITILPLLYPFTFYPTGATQQEKTFAHFACCGKVCGACASITSSILLMFNPSSWPLFAGSLFINILLMDFALNQVFFTAYLFGKYRQPEIIINPVQQLPVTTEIDVSPNM